MSSKTEEVLLTETEEKSVHAHGVDTEESMGNEVGAQRHSLRRTSRTRVVSPHFTHNAYIATTWIRTEQAGITALYTNSVRTHQDGYPVVVEMGSCILKGLHSPREEKEGKDPFWM